MFYRHNLILTTILLSFLLVFGGVHAEENTPSIDTLKSEARDGDSWAQLNLGAAYDHGNGVTRNLQHARYWYRKASENGNALAQFNLASLLLSGDLGMVESDRALHWLEAAARQEQPDALFMLGAMYTEGRDVERDDEKAVSYLLRAMDAGQPDAEAFLRNHYRIVDDERSGGEESMQ